ncbi:MAG: hypothetical protein ABFD20_02175 [Anaerolineales bacterium]
MEGTAPSRIRIAHAGITTGSPNDELGITPDLIDRKGLLQWLAQPGIDEELLSRLCHAYYTSRLFDIPRCLGQILATVYDEDIRLHERLPGAVVVLGMDVFIVGTPNLLAWITRFEGVQPAFDTRHRIGLPIDLGQRPNYAVDWEIHQAHWRLTAGDALVVVAGEGIELSNTRILRLAMRHEDPQDLADAVERATRDDEVRSGVLVCLAGGFAPVPAMPVEPPAPQPRHTRAIDDGWTPRRGLSPIIVALFVALVALLAAVHYVGVENASATFHEYINLVFGPEPTPTPTPEPTPTPAEPVVVYLPAPSLVSPKDGTRFVDEAVPLAWEWDRALAKGQSFDVRVGRAGETPVSVSVTTDRTAEYRPTQTGWYEWTVLVIGGEGQSQQVSELAPISSFFWQAGG